MQNELICPLCRNEYRDDSLPRILTLCGHTYCEKCIDTLITQNEGQFKIACPQDQTVIQIKSNSINNFPKNIALVKLIDSKKINSNSSLKDESLDITKIMRKEDNHEDEEAKELITAIKDKTATLEGSNEEDSGEALAKSLEIQEKQEEEMGNICLLHQKPLDVVCMVDLEKMCAKCAIFGEHKGHQFKSIENIQQECQNYHKEILNIYTEKQIVVDRINNEETKLQFLGLLNEKKKKIQKQIAQKYRKLIDKLKKSQEQNLKKLDDSISKTEIKIKKILQIDNDILEGYRTWEKESLKHIILVEDGRFDDLLHLLYKSNGENVESEMVANGKKLIEDLAKKQEALFRQAVEILQNIGVQFHDEIYEKIENFTQIVNRNFDLKPKIVPAKIEQEDIYQKILMNDLKSLSPHRHFRSSILEEDLLGAYSQSKKEQVLELKQKIQTAKYPQSNQKQEKIENNSNFKTSQSKTIKKKDSLANSKVEIMKSKSKEHFASEEMMNNNSDKFEKNERVSKKKLKSIKVPEKIQKILECLYNDTLDTLDLTNAELGDAVILQICEFLKGTKVKTVKFIRNKLNDETIPKMIAAFGNVITLNLSQNLLTQNCLHQFITYRQQLPSLKSITLSQNKIIQRKHKVLIDKLRKLDLTVSV